MIDFVTLYFEKSRYRLKWSESLVLEQSSVRLSDDIALEERIFDIANVQVRGKSIRVDDPLFKLRENRFGLYIQFNPSAIAYNGINFKIATYDEMLRSIETVKSKILDVVDLDFESGTLLRLDLAKDITPQYSFSRYIPMFQWLEGNRSAISNRWNTSYWWSHLHKSIHFYDKRVQLRNILKGIRLNADQSKVWDDLQKPKNLIRVEVKLKRSYLIKNELKMVTLSDLLDPTKFSYLEDTFKEVIRKMILSKEPKGTSSSYCDPSDVGLLKSLLENVGERSAIDEWLILLGLESVMEKLGGIEGFQSGIKEAGFVKGTVSKQTKKIKERLELLRVLATQDSKSSPTLPNLYQEIINLVMS